ncbi:MAG: KEOPS complex subunit Pcc1 [Thermoplasmata archaeon]|nr:KEOPS complex subunit Pcc1 [Thermoplasmata archaeon]
MIHCTIMIENDNVEKILKSIELDNGIYVNAKIENKKLICEIESENINSFSRTIDDLLQAIALSMKILNNEE